MILLNLLYNHTLNGQPFTDICDLLQGKYPKDFKFTGWHPQCRCHAISILKTQEEMMKDNELIMNGEEPNTESNNTVKDVPDNFKKWTADNKDRIDKANNRGTLPYFMKDNANFAEISVKDINLMNRVEYIEKSRVKNIPNELKGIKFTERYEGKNGGYLDIIQQNKNEYKMNISTYMILADKGGKYALLPPSDTEKSPDAFNIERLRYSDAKNANSSNGKSVIQNSIKNANKQNAREVVIRFSNDVSSRDLYDGLKAALYNGRAKNIEEIILIRNNNPLYLNVKKLRERFKK